EEMAILLRFKRSLLLANPSALQSWKPDDRSPCEWQGVSCVAKHVISIDLSNQRLTGPIPDAIGLLADLESLILAANSLNGSIPDAIGNLGGLRTLNISNNSLSGSLPRILSPGIQFLNISSNNLTGAIPPELFSQCQALERLDLSGNQFHGSIPSSLGGCAALEVLSLENTNLVGEIPPELASGSLASLTDLNLANNHLVGSIPGGLFVPSLRNIDLSLNNLTGEIPREIFRSADLENLFLSQNHFTRIPPEIGLLRSLRFLVLGRNNITELPASIANCSELRVLILNENLLAGEIPAVIAKLAKLQFLVLHTNGFTGGIPEWIATSHRQLLHLDLSDNRITGVIPSGFNATSLAKLQFLLLAGNRLTGSIPPSLGEISQLQFLDLSGNRLTGSIPPSLGKLGRLLWLMLANNMLSGTIPRELGNCSSLLWLNAAKNSIGGELPPELESMGKAAKATFDDNIANLPQVPKEIGECAVLRRWLPSNYPPFSLVYKVLDRDRCQLFWNLLLRGKFIYSVCSTIPTEKSMGYIQLSENRLSGSIPASYGGIDRLSLLFLYQNRLSGAIPGSLSNLKLTGLNLSHNALEGAIPDSFGQFQCLQSLDLSSNRLSGQIPYSLTRLTSLNKFNVSYNPGLAGPIPFAGQLATFDQDSFIGDSQLCYVPALTGTSDPSTAIPFCDGSPRNPSSSSSRGVPAPMHASTILGISLACALGVIAMGLAAICWMTRRGSGGGGGGEGGGGGSAALDSQGFKMMKSSSARFDHSAAMDAVSLFTMDLPKQLTYKDLVAATGNFHDSNIVGCGGFGVVYKARLSDGSTVAIKKLIREGPAGEREFQAEMHTLGHIVHENLVPLMGYSSYGAQKLLVYELMVNGSVEDWLYGCRRHAGGAGGLDWLARLDVAIGTARGLKFLHHSCSPPIIHRDMKASNILLDAGFRPCVTDFGLARALAGQEETHVSTIVAGTLGYVPPEYCQTWRATVKGDVYSYGVVLLELLSGRRPMLDAGNYIMAGEDSGRDLHHNVEEFEDQCYSNLVEWAFLRLALDCTQDVPVRRPCMRDVCQRLEDIKEGGRV
ncbi:hypothetical protein SELMODRAFT_128869, partial [Selaginella moellendorffii]